MEETVATCPNCSDVELFHETTPASEMWSCRGCGWVKRQVLVTKCCATSWTPLVGAKLPLITCDACGMFCEARLETHVMNPLARDTFRDVTTTYTPNNASHSR